MRAMPVTVWGALTSTAAAVDCREFETRPATPDPSDGTWSGYGPVAGGAIQSPAALHPVPGALNTTDDRVAPSLDRVEIDYDSSVLPRQRRPGRRRAQSRRHAARQHPAAVRHSLVADKTQAKVSVVAKSCGRPRGAR